MTSDWTEFNIYLVPKDGIGTNYDSTMKLRLDGVSQNIRKTVVLKFLLVPSKSLYYETIVVASQATTGKGLSTVETTQDGTLTALKTA